jgi:hypothetical protein
MRKIKYPEHLIHSTESLYNWTGISMESAIKIKVFVNQGVMQDYSFYRYILRMKKMVAPAGINLGSGFYLNMQMIKQSSKI